MVGFFKVGDSYRFNGNSGKWYSFTITRAFGDDRYEVLMLGIDGYHPLINESFAEGTTHQFTLRTDEESGEYVVLSGSFTLDIC